MEESVPVSVYAVVKPAAATENSRKSIATLSQPISGLLLLASGRLLQRIRERHVLILLLHLLIGLHHQHIPARKLTRPLLGTTLHATCLGHCIFKGKNFYERGRSVFPSSEIPPWIYNRA